MRRHSDITAVRRSPHESRVTITLRTPEAAKAIDGTSRAALVFIWAIGATALTVFAWHGGFGDTIHGFFRLTMAVAALFGLLALILDVWRVRDGITLETLTVLLTPDTITATASGRPTIRIVSADGEIRFASRPHWQGRREEREERRVGHRIGYEFRDAWEVWCEAGISVACLASVAAEDDARAIARHLTEEHLFVSRGDAPNRVPPRRAEPA